MSSVCVCVCLLCGLRSADMMMVTPINDLHGWEPSSMVKGERLMRCKLASVHRLFDLFGWAQIGHACLTVSPAGLSENSNVPNVPNVGGVVNAPICFPPPLWQLRVNKEQEHFLVLPDGLAYSEATGSSLVRKTLQFGSRWCVLKPPNTCALQLLCPVSR